MPANVARATATAAAAGAKNVTCSICQEKFSRKDHLKRHQLRHSGIKPYLCIFCNDAFTRSDNMRDHYPSCAQRRNRAIPDPARGGRRSHACDSCTSMKLGCDGNSPCKTCRHKGIECKFSRSLSKPSSSSRGGKMNSSKAANGQEHNPSSDRGSIKFLLNSGTASFIECFRFPSSNERRNIASLTRNESVESKVTNFFSNGSETGSSIYSDPFEDEQTDWKLFEDENLLRFLSSPFTENQLEVEDIYAPPVYLDPSFAAPDQMGVPIQMQKQWEPPSPQSAAIVQAILDRAAALNLTLQEQAEINQHLNYLFTPSRINKLISLYFEYWHPHCPILHQPSFSLETIPYPLLIPVALMGAMYSQVDREVSTAKHLLDLAELLVYSIDDLTDDSEIRQMMRDTTGLSHNQRIMTSPLVLENLQTAYLMVCVQFWAGNAVARKRAVETRFGIVVKVARRIGLHKERHGLEDSVDENLWLLKESRIRLINIMTLLDCAFSFFANFPCHLTVTEMKFDLPCEENLFASRNPFSEPTFKASRNLTTYEAFNSLFIQPNPQLSNHSKKNPLGLNPMDMFILIHLLYTYTHTQITQFSSTSTPLSPTISGSTTPNSTQNHSASTFASSNITVIKQALSRWRSLWMSIRANIPSHAWATLGFFRNGYNFWLVTQLLVNNRGSVEVMLKMEVNCEDTLEVLKGLLKEGGADT